MKKLRLNIKGIEYLISFPNVGQMIDIEQLKLAYTQGKYVEFAMSNLMNHVFVLDFTDSICYLSTLIPELKDDMKITNWTQMSAEDTKEIMKAYKNQFLPWFKPLLDDLYSYNRQEVENSQNELESDEKQSEE